MASLSDDEETNEQKLLSLARHGDVDGLKSLLVNDTELPNGDLELPVSTCNVNCKGTSKATRGWAPLHLTCYFGHHDATEILLKHGADIDVMNDTGDTPLHKAVYTSRLDIVMLLLQHNAKIDILNAEGLSVKQMAKNSEIKCLLEAVEGVSQQRQEHEYLSAVRTGSADAVKHVLNSSMQLNINCTDFFGNTALHIASSRGYKEVAVLLLQVAVDSNVKNIKGQTAIDVCHSEQMRDLLDVKPLRELQKIVQRYEAPLMKKSRVLGWKPYWVVLERGVISFFKNRADACTGVRRKTFRYLDNAKVKSSLSDYHSFTVYCSNGSQLKLAVTETNNAQLHRQRWENALSSHVTYSNSFLRCGVSDDNDDDNDIISVGSMMDTLQTCQAYQQLLSQHVAHTRQSINNFTARTVPSALQVELLKVHQGLHDVSNTSQAMCSSLTHCLSVITQQEHLRKRQLEQEVERSRVLQDALHVLAQENHTLEKRVSAGHKSPRKSAPGDSTERINQSPTQSDNHMTDDMDQSDDSEIDDLFYDCDNVHIDNELNKALTLSTNQNNCSNEQPFTNSLTNGANNELPNEEVEVKSKWNGRTRLPVPMISRNDFSVWSILRQCIGKELSKITMPVVFNEPLSFVQRVVEYMEYATLLQKACECNDPVQRMEYVTAFAVSMSASNWDRLGKPFNPLLGETYELEREDLGFKIVCEQVCHHPPVSAFHAEGEDFSFHGAIHPKLKFWGRSVEIQPKGIVTLHLKPFDEVYTWNNVNCCVHNIIVGKLWIEHYGTMDIVNHKTKHKMSLNFKGHGWTGKDLHKVEGFIYDDKKNKLRALYGKWIEGLYSYDMHTWDTYTALKAQGQDVELPPTTPGEATESIPIKGSSCDLNLSNQRCLWVAEPRPPNSQNYYCFTMYAMMLNELRDEDKAKLPPTDSRLRPDINRLEEGDLDGAAEHKHCLEEKQRHSKKERKKRKEEWVPRWFQLDTNPHTGKEDWIFTNEYWRRNWSRCPDVF